MPLYAKKPVLDDAEQYLNADNPPRGVVKGSEKVAVITIHGQITFVELGDWIIKERQR